MVVKLVEEFAREFNISYDSAFHWVTGLLMGFGIGFGFCLGLGCNSLAHDVARLYSFLKNKFSKKSKDADC